MSSSIVPINNLHQFGVLKDTPGLALAPNAFSDSLNVRFDNGCISKISGEADLVPQSVLDAYNSNVGIGDIQHITYWQNPNLAPSNGYFIVVATLAGIDSVYAINANTHAIEDLGWSTPTGGDWQHTEFQGGYAIVLNNGRVRPCYILDKTGNTDITELEAFELPGWDSYYTKEDAVNDVYDSQIHIPDFDIGRVVDFTIEQVIVTVYDSDNVLKFSNTLDTVGTVLQTTLFLDNASNSHVVSIALAAGGSGPDAFTTFLENGDKVVISVRSLNTVQVRAGVIRAWGDTLVAGNLVELSLPTIASVTQATSTIDFDTDHNFTTGDKIFMTLPVKQSLTVTVVDSDTITVSPALPVADYSVVRYSIHSSTTAVRNQPGVVRISDVASPGAIPNNWNPYGVGVSSADEFQLASTGIIQELAEMQGRLYIYTNNSIHSISKTSSSIAPYAANTVTSSFGALSRDCVVEFNGVHIVVGSNDIYKFAGHPASIETLASNRVQDHLFKNIAAEYVDLTHILVNRAHNELWINYCEEGNSSINTTLIWNYGNNTWSIREVSNFNYSVIAPTRTPSTTDKTLSASVNPSVLRPIMCTNNQIFGADFEGIFTSRNDTNYESFIERTDLAMTPEFDTEYLSSISLWVDKDVETDIPLQLRFRSTDYPGQSFDPLTSGTTGSTNPVFTVGKDYKTDARINGRFLHFRLSDLGNVDDAWKVIQFQLDIGKGGRR